MSDSRRFESGPRGRGRPALAQELDAYGCALTPALLCPAECRDLAALYGRPEVFRSGIDLARHRFGSGEYRYTV